MNPSDIILIVLIVGWLFCVWPILRNVVHDFLNSGT